MPKEGQIKGKILLVWGDRVIEPSYSKGAFHLRSPRVGVWEKEGGMTYEGPAGMRAITRLLLRAERGKILYVGLLRGKRQ